MYPSTTSLSTHSGSLAKGSPQPPPPPRRAQRREFGGSFTSTARPPSTDSASGSPYRRITLFKLEGLPPHNPTDGWFAPQAITVTKASWSTIRSTVLTPHPPRHWPAPQ